MTRMGDRPSPSAIRLITSPIDRGQQARQQRAFQSLFFPAHHPASLLTQCAAQGDGVAVGDVAWRLKAQLGLAGGKRLNAQIGTNLKPHSCRSYLAA